MQNITNKRKKENMNDEASKPLSQLEAGRVKTEIQQKHDKKVLYRELYGYTPEQVAARFGLRVKEVIEMAGRQTSEKQKG
jgi:DNA-directed RNA polymerase specialized sigma24 family protein